MELEAFLAAWLLLVIFCIYLCCAYGIPKGWKWGLSIMFIIGETLLLCGTALSTFLQEQTIFEWLKLLWATQFVAMCCYRLNKTHPVSIVIGAVALVAVAVYMYHNGTVMPESYMMSRDYFVTDYELYRVASYSLDVMIPFALVYNLIIAPFWLRHSDPLKYFRK